MLLKTERVKTMYVKSKITAEGVEQVEQVTTKSKIKIMTSQI
jgi:hypothetical protein